MSWHKLLVPTPRQNEQPVMALLNTVASLPSIVPNLEANEAALALWNANPNHGFWRWCHPNFKRTPISHKATILPMVAIPALQHSATVEPCLCLASSTGTFFSSALQPRIELAPTRRTESKLEARNSEPSATEVSTPQRLLSSFTPAPNKRRVAGWEVETANNHRVYHGPTKVRRGFTIQCCVAKATD